jgi:DNA mismatch endonuclease (patch repair protein)
MSRIRGKNTWPERTVFRALRAKGVRFSRHARDLPGSPDIVFRDARLAVFVHGDFWHGWRFPAWEGKLRPFWRKKIAGNRARDRACRRRLRRAGWQVVVLWQHQIDADLDAAIGQILEARANARPARPREGTRSVSAAG